MEVVKKIIMELIPYVIVVLLVILIRTFIVTPVRVNGSSMLPTLIDGEFLLLEKFNNKYNRFDIIVLDHKGEKLVKRIIGLPGEFVEYKNNKLYINNEEVKEEISSLETYDFSIEELGYTQIPKDYYFVMGDNRQNSTDSRYIGLIHKEDIVGEVNIIVFPFTRFGYID
jgi:signal peptidase I